MGSQSDWSILKQTADTLDALGIAHDDRIVSAHRTPDRLVTFAKGARSRRLQGHHRRRRRRRAPARHDRRHDAPARARRADRIEGPRRPGQPLFDRPDAGGRSGRHACHRPLRRDQRRALSPPPSWRCPTTRSPPNSTAGAWTRPRPSTSSRNPTMPDRHGCAAAGAGHDRRHSRRRSARPHAGAGRRRTRASPATSIAPTRRARRSPCPPPAPSRPTRTRRRSPHSPAPSMWRPRVRERAGRGGASFSPSASRLSPARAASRSRRTASPRRS